MAQLLAGGMSGSCESGMPLGLSMPCFWQLHKRTGCRQDAVHGSGVFNALHCRCEFNYSAATLQDR